MSDLVCHLTLADWFRWTWVTAAAMSVGCDGDVVLWSTVQATESAVVAEGITCGQSSALAVSGIRHIADPLLPMLIPADNCLLGVAVKRCMDGRWNAGN